MRGNEEKYPLDHTIKLKEKRRGRRRRRKTRKTRRTKKRKKEKWGRKRMGRAEKRGSKYVKGKEEGGGTMGWLLCSFKESE